MDNQLAPERLRAFAPFENMADDQLLVLASKLEVRRVAAGTVLFRCGDVDSQEYFLLTGVLELAAEDGRKRTIESQTEVASRPIARLRPRQYTATAHRSCEYIAIDSDLLDELLANTISETIEVGYGVDEISEDPLSEAERILESFKADLDANSIVLTSLPEIAIKIRQLIDEGNVNTSAIAKLVNRDPAIAAKLIKAANSPIYLGSSNCETVNNAIVRLGLNTTRQLVISFTLRDLFKSDSPVLRKSMEEVWQHSVTVAALSFVLAKQSEQFEAEEAMLAGLVSNIGALLVLQYLQNFPEVTEDSDKLAVIVAELKGEVGALILEKWRFPSNMVEVARGCEDWARCPTSQADLCDLVLMATLHSFIGKRMNPPPPQIDSVPAYTKLSLGKLTPEKTLLILEEAREDVSDARRILLQ